MKTQEEVRKGRRRKGNVKEDGEGGRDDFLIYNFLLHFQHLVSRVCCVGSNKIQDTEQHDSRAGGDEEREGRRDEGEG